MLRDVIEYVKSRAGIPNRDVALREINFAWKELWNIDDLPGSIMEISAQPETTSGRFTLPPFVGKVRAVKSNSSRLRVFLLTPRSQFQAAEYIQSPYSWIELGTHPLYQTVTNATTLDFSITEAEDIQFAVTIIGPTDRASEDREQITFPIGTLSVQSTKRFTDVRSISKEIFTKSDVLIYDSTETEIGMIPNNAYEGRNTIIQVTDRCTSQLCTECKCYDILYKSPVPILYYDEQSIPGGYDEALMTKTLEWIMLPKEGQDQKAILYGEKSKALMQFNNEESGVGKTQKVDLTGNRFCTQYYGYL